MEELKIHIDRIQWTGKNIKEVYKFLSGIDVKTMFEVPTRGKYFYIDFNNGTCNVGTLMVATGIGKFESCSYTPVNMSDYIIKEIVNDEILDFYVNEDI